jgi:hypothetical protein
MMFKWLSVGTNGLIVAPDFKEEGCFGDRKIGIKSCDLFRGCKSIVIAIKVQLKNITFLLI